MSIISNKSGLIYCATNLINGKKYIGLTTKGLNKRKNQHLTTHLMNNDYFHNSLRKYGKENFEWEILEENINIESLSKRETFYIKKLNTFSKENGYNAKVEENGKIVISEDTKKRQSDAHKLLMEENRRKYNGSNISEKTREKLSKRKLATAKRNREKYNGSARSPEHENKRMKSIKKYFDENRKKYNGYAVSNELREKFSKNSLGRKHTEKTKNKLSNIFSGENNPSYGTHMSKEDKIKNVLLNHKRDLLKTNTSGFVGLKKYNGKKGIKWQVVYKYNKKAYYLGTYDTKLEAAKAYDDKMIELFGVEAASNKNLGLY